MDRVILHVDMDAFYASVEQRDHPEYRGKPLVVGAPRDARGVVSTCSYEARAFGVHSAMASREAARLCPQAIFVLPDMETYSRVSRQVMAIFERFTPIVEPVSVDEAYLDVIGARALFGSGEEIGAAIRAAIRDELRLTASVGVAPNKFVAKICSELAKPNGMKIAPFDREGLLAFLAPLPVGRLPGVGKVLTAKLEGLGYRLVGDLQRADRASLRAFVGENGTEYLRRLAFGVDPSEVATEREELSLSREYTFGTDCADRGKVRNVLRDLVDDVGERLRASGKWAGLVKIKLRWSDFTTISRQRQLSRPARDNFTLFEEGAALFDRERLVAPVRLVGFGVGDLGDGTCQQELDLFGSAAPDSDASRDRKERLSSAIDAIRSKLGPDSIRRG